MNGLWAGVDIGGSNALVVLCDGDGREVASVSAVSGAHLGGEAILDRAAALVTSVAPASALAGVGVGAAGVVEPATGTIVVTGDSFTGWAGTAVNVGLTGRLGGVPVVTENDVNAFLLGELSTSDRHLLGVALGTGVGGAVFVDGALLHGGGTGAGEIGHVGNYGPAPCTCGQTGHLEAYASGRSLARRYALATGLAVRAEVVAEAALAGGQAALTVFTDAGRYLGEAITHACGLLGIATAVVGGSATNSWALLEKPIQEALLAHPLLSGSPVDVRPARGGAKAVALGAVALARSFRPE
ncbi:ROK family protein [Amycolatopsis sp. FDAARGOS 1241]|uniref:ROK family protein n=1 Tax=Amycolatopsis sp. FDAARGOS 1241 TaxID=2778070 RepID=UPI001951E8E4|nr:ROK family protein [Amycolatopsis sp. FDAARGOS 1241]QRP47614.1 ROK family protein [Amycolatopsis sp. FDAARGOS 1241]